MRSWQIIVASAVGATIADCLLFVPGVVPWRPETAAALFLLHWPAITVVWLGVYGIAALFLTTLAAFLVVSGGAAPERPQREWARRYVAGLTVSQYFTAVLALLGLGLSRIPVETPPFLVLPSALGGSLALTACGAVIVAGLFGGALLTAAVSRAATTPEPRSPEPGLRADRLIRDVVQPPLGEVPAAASAGDVARLADLVERGQRSILEAIKDLAIAVNRLRWGLDEIKLALQAGGPERSSEAGSATISVTEDAAAELRAAAAAVDASVARLGEMAVSLAANETPRVAGRSTPTSRASRAQLSRELQALLREINPVGDGGDPPS